MPCCYRCHNSCCSGNCRPNPFAINSLNEQTYVNLSASKLGFIKENASLNIYDIVRLAKLANDLSILIDRHNFNFMDCNLKIHFTS